MDDGLRGQYLLGRHGFLDTVIDDSDVLSGCKFKKDCKKQSKPLLLYIFQRP